MRTNHSSNNPASRICTRAVAGEMCDPSVVKTRRPSWWVWMLSSLLAGGSFALQAQTDAANTNTADTNAVAPVAATTNAASTNTVTATAANENDAVAATVETERAPEPGPKPAASSGKLDFSSFKSVAERNIFNGNRSGQRMTSTRSSTQQRSVRVESFSLVGTLLSEDRDPVAFFDGTGSELRKALKAGGTIAGFTVKEILHAGVRLAEGTNTLDVLVGSGMRREDEGLWKSSTVVISYASASGGGTSGGSGGSSSSRARTDNTGNNNGRSAGRNAGGRNGATARSDTGGGSAASSSSSSDSLPAAQVDEVLKRLMEKREKE